MKNRIILTPYFLDERSPGLDVLAEPSWQVNEVLLAPGEKQEHMLSLYRPLVDFVAKTSHEGDRPVSVAGDCCTTVAVLAGLQQGGLNPTLIWFDAHGDFNTWETTPSGFLGGMPLAWLVGRGEQTLVEGTGLKVLPEEQVILTDARDLDPEEREALEDSDLQMLPDVAALLDGPLPTGPIYVHFDADVLNPDDAPAMSYLATGGPPAALLSRVFRRMAQSGQVAGVSVSAWNPNLDEDGRSQVVVMDLLQELIAE